MLTNPFVDLNASSLLFAGIKFKKGEKKCQKLPVLFCSL